MSGLPEEQIKARLGEPEIGMVRRRDGNPSASILPRYLVRPAMFRGSETEVRIVDLGQGEANSQENYQMLMMEKHSSTMIPQHDSVHHVICARQSRCSINR